MISSRPPSNGFVAVMRKAYNPLGFAKGYNFILWFIFSGALLGFVLARLMYLDYNGVYCSPGGEGMNHAGPGACHAYSSRSYYLVGIKMHLYTILPAGLLAYFQFVPAIRHKAILVHRINGYLVILLSLAGVAGALMIARVSFGGGLDVQVVVGLLAIMFVGSLALAYYNIKRLQIEQHRAWMLRAWFYAASIITCRLIMFIASIVTSGQGGYYNASSCQELAVFYDNTAALVEAYPTCKNQSAWVAVAASMNLDSAEHPGASLNITFGMGLWLAVALHAIGIEIYLQLTPAESDRLRNVSYQRQLEAGFRNPGRAGITADRIGDSERWVPIAERGLNNNRKAVFSDSQNDVQGKTSGATDGTGDRGTADR